MKIKNLTQALLNLYPNAIFSVESEDYGKLTIDIKKPTFKELEAESGRIDIENINLERKAEINTETDKEIFKIIGADDKFKALIKQSNLQDEVMRIFALKMIKGKFPAGGEARIKEIGEIQERIAAVVKSGKILKGVLNAKS